MKKKRFIRSGLIAVLGIAVVALSTQAVATIKDTRHNLSNWGKYTVKATTENQVCIFCHAPHNADSVDAPLWNHKNTEVTTFQMASTANVSPGNRSWMPNNQPTGISKKCLSCHDGTVAIGMLGNGNEIIVTGASGSVGGNPNNALAGTRTQSGKLTSGDYGYIGTDLRGGHVISFNYDQFQQNVDPPQTNYKSWGTIMTDDPKNIAMFDRNRNMQCHTCHDPHNDWCDDNAKTVGRDPLWRKSCDSTTNDVVCKVCHKNFGVFKAYSF